MYAIGLVALLAVVLMAGVSIYFAGLTGRAADNLFKESLAAALDAGELELALEKHRRLIEGYSLDAERHDRRVDLRAVEDVAARLGELVAKTDDPSIRRVANRLPQLLRFGENIIGVDGSRRTEGRLPTLLAAYVELADTIHAEIRAYSTERVQAAAMGADLLQAKAQRLISIVSVLAAVAVIFIGPVSFWLVQNTAERVRGVTEAIVRLAYNDTSVTLPANAASSDEIGLISRAVEIFKANAIALLDNTQKLKTVNDWLDIALNNMSRGLSMYDANQQLVVCNANYARIYELPNELIRPGTPFERVIEHRKTLVSHVGADPLDPVLLNAAERVKAIASINQDTRSSLTLKNGSVIEVTTRPLKRGGWVALHEDVTERRRIADRVVFLARHDSMTGLANRHFFRDTLEASLAGLARGERLALHCIDLDRFKHVNDTLGHPVGDQLLQMVGKRLQEAVRGGDFVARIGGDEFAVIQRTVRSSEDAAGLGRRLISVVSAGYQILGQKISIGATIGIALGSEDGRDPETLMKSADMALYRGKSGGRGEVVFYEPEMDGELRARVQLEGDLQHALGNGELELFYQPIVSLTAGVVSGCEALLRWRHPHRGMVSPAEFIPVAEDIGLIVKFGEFAIRSACGAAADWPDDVAVAVNLSAAQFGACDLVSITCSALQESGLAAGRLILEVTESVILDDNPETVEVLHDLRALGVRIALDDFGTGYSSLSYLKSFPFDKIKIDQSFVKELSQRSACVAIVGAVAELARSLSMTTVAEGVETEDHLAKVRAAGCTEAQGYLFSRPVPSSEVAAAIQASNQRLAGFRAAA